jgi:AcrR family transcriptional regulator
MKPREKRDPLPLEDAKSRLRRILETAAQLIHEHGYEKASMQQIAEACQLTKAGLYYYIRSKEHLLADIMNYGMDVFEEQVLSKVLPIVDPVERLEAAMERNVRLVTEGRNRAITVILHEHDTLTGQARAQINARKKRYVRFLESSFTEAMRDGRIRPGDPKVAAFAFLGMVNWIYKWYRPDGQLSADRIAREMRQLFFGGLRVRPASNREAAEGSST